MEENHTSRSSRRNSESPVLLIFLLILVFINSLGLGYLVYRTYQSDTGTSNVGEKITKLEDQVNKLNSSLSTGSIKTASGTETTTSTPPAASEALPQTGGATTESSVAAPEPTEAPAVEPAAEQPAAEPAVEEVQPQPTTYVVQAGDALSLIAEQHGLSLEELMIKNNLSDTNVLIGTELLVR
ncbi:LysM peptidoglycan-binding domain-containing protein [Enterococcus sp. LJL128]|uniref:LysM peptidoglycan-binding domain-containing protein n=1 Tax=Enterococcus sp. LJL51 TaxID=3416656 RepID=UPI003CF64EAF